MTEHDSYSRRHTLQLDNGGVHILRSFPPLISSNSNFTDFLPLPVSLRNCQSFVVRLEGFYIKFSINTLFFCFPLLKRSFCQSKMTVKVPQIETAQINPKQILFSKAFKYNTEIQYPVLHILCNKRH